MGNVILIATPCHTIWIFMLLSYLIYHHFTKRKISTINNNVNKIEILQQSTNYLIVNKPYDMVVNSNDENLKNTLQRNLKNLFPNLVNPTLKHEFYFVHRLDYATSGIICIALNKSAARAASIAFEKRQTRKYYLALVHGHVEYHYFVINKSIGNDVRELLGSRKMCTDDSKYCNKPRRSTTGLLVLEKGFRNNVPATKVLLRPETGRRHQLRVHCQSIGHTIIGDYTYSDKKDTEPHRTFLHSFRLIFNNEIEGFDIKTFDPFDNLNSLNKWKPTTIINKLDDESFDKIDRLFL